MSYQEPPVQKPETTPRQPLWPGRFSHALKRLPGQGRKHWQALLIGALVLAVLAVLFGGRHSSSVVGAHRVAPDTMSFPVGSQPELIFAHSIGNVHITGGNGGQVLIKEKKNGFPDAIQIHYAQAGDKITTTADIQSGLMEDTWVDFDVSIPSQTGVIVALENGGTLEADGLSGQIALSNTNGSIWATNLTGAVTMRTESGSINAKQVNGQMALSTQNGTITTSGVHLRGHSMVQAQSGTINFHGSLDPKGNALFKNGNGAVGLTLARGAAFRVDARSSSGAININYPGIVARHTQGNEARGTVGKPPLAGLTIQTGSGPITIVGEAR
jgi:hypothetical protein